MGWGWGWEGVGWGVEDPQARRVSQLDPSLMSCLGSEVRRSVLPALWRTAPPCAF